MTRGRLRRWGGLAAALFVLTACTVGPSQRPDLVTSEGFDLPTGPGPVSSAPPTGPGGPGQTSAPVNWRACSGSYESTDPVSGRSFTLDCATVRVPRTYPRQQSTGTMPIALTRARADGTGEDAPALVTVLGDPGSLGATDAAAVAGRLPEAITAKYAVVVPDLRGTGSSLGVSCVTRSILTGLLAPPADPGTSTGSTMMTRLSRALTFECTDQAGPDLSRLSTIPAADDLDTIRAALGADRLNFLGQGYGGTLGAVYAHRYPALAGKLVLDAPSDPLLAVDKAAVDRAAVAEKALDTFAAACPTFDGGCPLGSDPRAAVVGLIDDLGDQGRSGGSMLVNGGSVVRVLLAVLGEPDRWPALATALGDAREDRMEPLEELLIATAGGDRRRQQLSGQIIYSCNDTSVRLGGERLSEAISAARKDSPVFGPYLLGTVGQCADWPAPSAPLGAVSAAGAPPLLVLGAVDDPVSSYSGVRSLAGQLTSAVLVSWQSGTHGGYPASSCLTAAVNGYLLEGSTPPTGTLCPP